MNTNSKFVLRSRQLWTIASVALFALVGASREMGVELPIGLEQKIDGIVQAVIGLTVAILSFWSLIRPDNAKLTWWTSLKNTPIGKATILKGATTLGAILLTLILSTPGSATPIEIIVGADNIVPVRVHVPPMEYSNTGTPLFLETKSVGIRDVSLTQLHCFAILNGETKDSSFELDLPIPDGGFYGYSYENENCSGEVSNASEEFYIYIKWEGSARPGKPRPQSL
jgi:hypothetical protein